MKKVVFVILHYITFEDTKECVESILNNVKYDNYSIVIVDNYSRNGSVEKLKDKFNDNSKICIIENDSNLGFAKGNNVGFRYAKYNLKADYIVMINNDMILEDEEFVNKLIETYEKDKYHILGPDIISLKDKGHQNPAKDPIININQVKKLIFSLRVKLLLNYLYLEEVIKVIRKIKVKFNKDKQENLKDNFLEKKQKNIKLHGSCLIFSKDYIEAYDGLFDKTFLFMEEDILYYTVKRDNLITEYNPQMKILHKEDSSTDALLKSDYKKRRFSYRYNYKSAKIFLELLKSDSEKQEQ